MSIKHTKTWEDSWVEKLVLEEILESNKDDHVDVLLLCGAGDIALSLLSDRVNKIVCVDPSNANLALLELKAILCKKTDHPNERLMFMEGQYNPNEMKSIYESIRKELKISQKYWDSHLTSIIKGLHKLDTLTRLFNLLTYDHRSESQIKNDHPQNYDYEYVFSNKNIIKYFGNKYLKNTYLNKYSHHFKKCLCDLHGKYYLRPRHNIFYNQMMYNDYPYGSFPLYMTEMCSDFPVNRIKYIHQRFSDYLCSEENKYRKFNIISLSNLTDFMDENQIKLFVSIVRDKVKAGGRGIFRRMNGNVPLRDIINKDFMILEIDRDFRDRTGLYKEVIVGCPRK